jgi:hypothetical protein
MANPLRQTVTVATTAGMDVTSVSSFNLSINVASNPNRCLVLTYGNGQQNILSATFNGKSFTKAIRSVEQDGNAGEVWYLVNPDVGTYNISVSVNGTTDARALAGAVSLYNVDQTNPVNLSTYNINTGSGITVSFTPTENNCIAVDAGHQNGNTAGSQGAGQTLIRKRSAGRSGGTSYKAVNASSSSMSWSGFQDGTVYSSYAVAVFQGSIPMGGSFLYNLL